MHIHFANMPPRHEANVTALATSLLGVCSAIPLGSPSRGQFESMQLDTTESRTLRPCGEESGDVLYAPEERTAALYRRNTAYDRKGEHRLRPIDAGIPIP